MNLDLETLKQGVLNRINNLRDQKDKAFAAGALEFFFDLEKQYNDSVILLAQLAKTPPVEEGG